MNLYPNPTGIPNGKIWGLFSMLNTDGGLAFGPQTCKETTYFCIGQDVHVDYSVSMCSNRYVAGRINRTNPTLVFWTRDNSGFGTRDEAVGRIHDAIHMLCEKMGLSKPSRNGH